MTEYEPIELNLEIARNLFPVGGRVTGRVTQVPRPGTIGLFVDLGQPPTGFVDVLNLPDSVDEWPVVGTVTEFEVVHHTHQGHQVRLRPLNPPIAQSLRSRSGRCDCAT
ncbi:hypothetical protein [Nocardia sp. NPDC004711]